MWQGSSQAISDKSHHPLDLSCTYSPWVWAKWGSVMEHLGLPPVSGPLSCDLKLSSTALPASLVSYSSSGLPGELQSPLFCAINTMCPLCKQDGSCDSWRASIISSKRAKPVIWSHPTLLVSGAHRGSFCLLDKFPHKLSWFFIACMSASSPPLPRTCDPLWKVLS